MISINVGMLLAKLKHDDILLNGHMAKTTCVHRGYAAVSRDSTAAAHIHTHTQIYCTYTCNLEPGFSGLGGM